MTRGIQLPLAKLEREMPALFSPRPYAVCHTRGLAIKKPYRITEPFAHTSWHTVRELVGLLGLITLTRFGFLFKPTRLSLTREICSLPP